MPICFHAFKTKALLISSVVRKRVVFLDLTVQPMSFPINILHIGVCPAGGRVPGLQGLGRQRVRWVGSAAAAHRRRLRQRLPRRNAHPQG